MLIDEGLPRALARLAKAHGIDAVSVLDIERGLPNHRLAEIALTEKRVVVTRDRRFYRTIRDWLKSRARRDPQALRSIGIVAILNPRGLRDIKEMFYEVIKPPSAMLYSHITWVERVDDHIEMKREKLDC